MNGVSRRRPLPQLVKERILALRDARGLTSSKLADLAGLKRSALTNLEDGISPSLQRIERYAAGLGVHPATLLCETDEEAAGYLKPDEQELLARYRQVPEADRAAVAVLLELDDDGRRLATIWQALDDAGRDAVLGEAVKEELRVERAKRRG